MDIRNLSLASVVNGGSGGTNYVTYWSDSQTLAGSSSFTWNGTDRLALSNSNTGATRLTIANTNAGGGAYAHLLMQSSAGDVNFYANSLAAGGSFDLTCDATWTGGFRLGILGSNSLSLRTNNANGVVVDGNQKVTIGDAGGTQIHRFNTDTAVSAGAAGIFWRVNINGTDYKVQLYADS